MVRMEKFVHFHIGEELANSHSMPHPINHNLIAKIENPNIHFPSMGSIGYATQFLAVAMAIDFEHELDSVGDPPHYLEGLP